MTKEITKARIIQEIQDKFKLRDFEPETFTFSERVIPTYDIAEHLKDPTTAKATVSITGIGGKSLFIIPPTERWILHAYTVVFMGAGAHKVAGVYVLRAGRPTYFVYLDLTKNQTESYTVNLPKECVLDSLDSLNINIDEYTSTADIQVVIDVTKEEIR